MVPSLLAMLSLVEIVPGETSGYPLADVRSTPVVSYRTKGLLATFSDGLPVITTLPQSLEGVTTVVTGRNMSAMSQTEPLLENTTFTVTRSASSFMSLSVVSSVSKETPTVSLPQLIPATTLFSLAAPAIGSFSFFANPMEVSDRTKD